MDFCKLRDGYSKDSGGLFCKSFASSTQICQLAFFCMLLNFFSLTVITKSTSVPKATLLSLDSGILK